MTESNDDLIPIFVPIPFSTPPPKALAEILRIGHSVLPVTFGFKFPFSFFAHFERETSKH